MDGEDGDIVHAAGVIARSKAGRILMCRRTDGEGWAFPGGGIKEGEEADQAAWREFFEETGHRLGGVGRLHMRRVKDGVDFSTFVCDVEDEFVPKLNHEHDAWGWVNPVSLLNDVSGQAMNVALPPPLMLAFGDEGEIAKFEEGKHPRGQPKNKGQFGPGHGGGGGGPQKAAGGPSDPEALSVQKQGKAASEAAAGPAQGPAKGKAPAKGAGKGEAKAPKEDKPAALGPAPEVNMKALSAERLHAMSKMPLMEQPEQKEGSRNVGEVAGDLAKRAQDWLKEAGYKDGRVNSTNSTPAIDDALAHIIAEEAKDALKDHKGSGADWYTKKIEEAVKVAALHHPEIAEEGSPAQTAFKLALAVTSQGETVDSNAGLADRAYESWKQNPSFDKQGNQTGNKFNLGEGEGAFSAKHAPEMLANFAKYDKMVEDLGPEKTREFLHKKTTMKEMIDAGIIKKPVGGFAMDEPVYGSAIFGPKVGQGFFQNLSGNYDPVTQDLWFMRTFGRMTGTLRDVVKTSKGVDDMYERFRKALGDETGEDLSGASREDLDARSKDRFKQAEKDYETHGAEYRAAEKERQRRVKTGEDHSDLLQQPEAAMAAKRMDAYHNGVQEDPGSAADRKWRGDIVNRAREKLKAEGTEMSNADLQATIWYPEKDLWKHMGSRGPRGGLRDYSAAQQTIARKKGHGDDELRRLLGRDPDPDPQPAKSAQKPKPKAGAGAGPGTGGEGTGRGAGPGGEGPGGERPAGGGQPGGGADRRRPDSGRNDGRGFGPAARPDDAGGTQRHDGGHPQADGLGGRGLAAVADAVARLDARTARLSRRADADWEEGKHPRGQPGNPGQFGPGGAQAKKAEPAAPAAKAGPETPAAPKAPAAPKSSAGPAKGGEDPDKLDIPAVEWVHKLIDRHSANVEARRKHKAKMAKHIQNVDAFFKDHAVHGAIAEVAADAVKETPDMFGEVLVKKGAEFVAEHVSEVVNNAIMGAVTIAGVSVLGFGLPHLIASAAVGYAVEKAAEWLGITPENAGKLIKKAVKAIGAKVGGENSISKLMASLPWERAETAKFEGEQFVSSNVQKGTDIPSAVKALNSKRHKALLTASHDIDAALGITDSQDRSAIGAWEDGAEDTVMTVSKGATMAQLKVAAAMKGALADQRAVMVALANPKGKGVIYQFEVKGTPDTINDGLLSTAIEYHTIVPKDGGATVYIASADGNEKVMKAVKEAAEHFDAKVAYHRVDAELVGSNKDDASDEEQRRDAQQRYARIIKGSGVRGADDIWDGIQLRYAASFREEAQADELAAIADAVERLDARFARLQL
jgi:8-oxo-dGTP pyrophosphatase MutT (NUDIX family)